MKENKGITIVALAVTIIVLIILAGISINLTLGENGIITKAKQAKSEYLNAQEAEESELASLYNELALSSTDRQESDKTQNEDASKETVDKETFETEMGEMKQQIEEMQQTNTSMQQQIEEMKQANSSMQQEIQNLKNAQKIEDLSSQVTYNTEYINSTESSVSVLKQGNIVQVSFLLKLNKEIPDGVTQLIYNLPKANQIVQFMGKDSWEQHVCYKLVNTTMSSYWSGLILHDGVIGSVMYFTN